MLLLISFFVFDKLGNGILYFDDGFYPFEPRLDFFKILSSWDSPFFPGNYYYGNFYYLPFVTFVWFFRTIGISNSLTESLYLVINLFIGVVGIYLLTSFISIHYIFKNTKENNFFYLGSMLASFYYVFNFEQMTYYGGEFYQGFILINITPIFLFYVLKYLTSPTKYYVWNRYLSIAGILGLVMSGGLQGIDATGTDFVLFFIIFLVVIFFSRIMKSDFVDAHKYFYLKSVLLVSVIIVSISWTFQALLFSSNSSYSYISSTSYLGKKLLFAFSSSSPIYNLLEIISSGFFTQLGPFGTAGYNRIWYSPLEFISIHHFLFYIVYVPFIFSFLYILFFRKSNIRKMNLGIILIVSIIFYLTISDILNTSFLILNDNIFLIGLEYSLDPSYSVYLFVIVIAVTIAISINILINSLFSWSKLDLQSHFSLTYLNLPKPRNKFISKKSKARRLKILRWKKVNRLSVYTLIVLVILFFSLFSLPIINNPYENWQYQDQGKISAVFNPDNSFIEVGKYLEKNSMDNNVLMLPITASPYATSYNGSSFLITSPPFCSFFNGETLQNDYSFSNTSFAYPILKDIPSSSISDFANYLKLLGVKYIIVNMKEYPTWVEANKALFAGGGPPWNFSSVLNFLNTSKEVSLAKVFFPYYIYSIHNSLPLMYLSEGIASQDKSSCYPLSIFNEYANNSLISGDISIINSTNVISEGLSYNSQTLNSPNQSINSYINQYKISFSNYLTKQTGFYDQLEVVSDYSNYGINKNASNLYFELPNGTYLDAWIQNANYNTLVIWIKIPFNTPTIYMDVLPYNFDILSSNGIIGNYHEGTDNLKEVFPFAKLNYTFSTPRSNPYQMEYVFNSDSCFGLGFIIDKVGNMNYNISPFFQMNNQFSNWNPGWVLSKSISGNTTLNGLNKIYNINLNNNTYGYEYVYNNMSNQDTYQSVDGSNQSFIGNLGRSSSSFSVDGARSINISFKDIFQFSFPNGQMPISHLSKNKVTIKRPQIEFSGPRNIEIGQLNNYSLSTSSKNFSFSYKNISSFDLLKEGNIINSHLNYTIINNEIKFNLQINTSGVYSLLVELNVNHQIFYISFLLNVTQRNILNSQPIWNVVKINSPNNSSLVKRYCLSIMSPGVSVQAKKEIYNNLSINIKSLIGHINLMSHILTPNGIIFTIMTSNPISTVFTVYVSSDYQKAFPQKLKKLDEISPTHYMARANDNSSYYLILDQSYSKEWIAEINGSIIGNHFKANGFANAWLVPKGNYTIQIYFKPETLQAKLDYISLFSGIVLLILFLSDVTFVCCNRKKERCKI